MFLETTGPRNETHKKIRSVLGLWKVSEELQKEYPNGIIMLMDGSAPLDIQVIDPESGEIVAVEVKSAASTSKASRRLSRMQKKVRTALGSRQDWKVAFNKYVMYGEPGPEVYVRKVP